MPELEQLAAQPRRPGRVDRGRPAGEHQRRGRALADRLELEVVRQQLGVDAALADPARDQLRVLAAEVEHEDLLVRGRRRRDLDRLGDPGLTARRATRRAQASVTAIPFETLALPLEPMPTSCERWSCLPSVCSAGATITSARWKSRMSS